MKVQALASAVRVNLAASELEELLAMARAGQNASYSGKAATIIAGLETGLRDLRVKQFDARVRRESTKRAEALRRAREHHMSIDEYNITASLGDWVDTSGSVDFSIWSDMFNPDTTAKMSDQCEIRRNVWKVQVSRPARAGEEHRKYFLADCTEGADRRDIEAVARKIISTDA